METLQKIRAERQEADLTKTLQRFFRVDISKEPYYAEHSIKLNQLLKSLVHIWCVFLAPVVVFLSI